MARFLSAVAGADGPEVVDSILAALLDYRSLPTSATTSRCSRWRGSMTIRRGAASRSGDAMSPQTDDPHRVTAIFDLIPGARHAAEETEHHPGDGGPLGVVDLGVDQIGEVGHRE